MIQDPLKLALAIILVVLEVPAAIALAIMWRKACRRSDESEGINDRLAE